MELYARVVESIPNHAVVITDPAGMVISSNRAASLITGYAEEEILGAPPPWSSARGPTDPDATVIDASWRTRRDGSPFWCQATRFALTDADGALLGIAECFRDASEDHAREVALQESEARFRAALRTGSIVVCSQDRDLRYTWVPSAAPSLASARRSRSSGAPMRSCSPRRRPPA